jgi:autotransporter-associated beta strand protein
MSLRRLSPTLFAGCLLSLTPAAVNAQIVTTATFTNNGTTPAAWNVGANWSSNPDFPSGTGAGGVFTGPTTTGAQTVNLTVPITVGSLSFDNNTTVARTLANGGGSLTFDEVGTGPAVVTTMDTSGQGPGTAGNITISATMTLTDSVVANVNQTNQVSTAGSLNWTGGTSGPGGFTKNGDGLATFGTNAKLYTGPTVLNGGRMRMSVIGTPTATSSMTINAGAQLTLITANGNHTFGASAAVPLNLNGTGATSGPFAVFPGAIRNDTNLAATINNQVVLQSPTLLHVEGSTTGSITLPGSVSGTGSLTLTAPNSSVNQGQLVLNGTNSYSGGTLVRGGNMIAGATSVNAFGTGDVTVNNASSPDSAARITLQAGATDAINDLSFLSLAGGFATGGVTPSGFAILDAGINETVGGLVLGGTTQTTPGTYGSTSSGAMFQSDVFFQGNGVVTLAPIPEPGTFALAGLAAVGFAARRLRRKPVAA